MKYHTYYTADLVLEVVVKNIPGSYEKVTTENSFSFLTEDLVLLVSRMYLGTPDIDNYVEYIEEVSVSTMDKAEALETISRLLNTGSKIVSTQERGYELV